MNKTKLENLKKMQLTSDEKSGYGINQVNAEFSTISRYDNVLFAYGKSVLEKIFGE